MEVRVFLHIPVHSSSCSPLWAFGIPAGPLRRFRIIAVGVLVAHNCTQGPGVFKLDIAIVPRNACSLWNTGAAAFDHQGYQQPHTALISSTCSVFATVSTTILDDRPGFDIASPPSAVRLN